MPVLTSARAAERGSLWLKILALVLVFFTVSSCGKKSSSGDPGIPGVGQYSFTIANGVARLSVVFSDLKIDAGAVIPLAQPAGATIELGPDFTSGGTLFAITVPLKALFNIPGNLPLLGLPDGRAIPDVTMGAIQGAAVKLPLFGLSYLYMGKDVFGLYLPVNLPKVNAIVRVRMHDEAGNILGLFYGIPKFQTKDISGVLVLIPIEGGSTVRPTAMI